MLLHYFLFLLVIHWLADFMFQTHWQATNKSKNIVALCNHVAVYTFTFWIAAGFIFYNLRLATLYAIVNGLLHLFTDAITSRITSQLYAKGDTHNFFAVVGLDQLIHQITLAGTLMGFVGAYNV